jgi:hypothetical protein
MFILRILYYLFTIQFNFYILIVLSNLYFGCQPSPFFLCYLGQASNRSIMCKLVFYRPCTRLPEDDQRCREIKEDFLERCPEMTWWEKLGREGSSTAQSQYAAHLKRKAS